MAINYAIKYQPKVAAYVAGKISNSHDAEELVSSIFLKVVRKLDSFDPTKASVSTWIYTITRNTVIDYFRSRRVEVEYMDYPELAEIPSEKVDDDLDFLAEALLTLKEKERDLIVLYYFQGYTLKTVAERMGMSYSNAVVVHKKALSSLMKYYFEAQAI